jgi:hypothetical protein
LVTVDLHPSEKLDPGLRPNGLHLGDLRIGAFFPDCVWADSGSGFNAFGLTADNVGGFVIALGELGVFKGLHGLFSW